MASIVAMLMAASLGAVFGATTWMNGRPTAGDLHGKVVLVDVFTVDCINCQHVVPELRKLHATLAPADFRIVAIHTPETPYERNPQHVAESLRTQGIAWPVAIDNDGALWNAYRLEYWPTQMIFDRAGRLRDVVIGEGHDTEIESDVRQLIRERAATASSNERVYRLPLHGPPNGTIAVSATGPQGWLQTFCTSHLCAIRHAMVRLSANGSSTALLHVYRIASVSPASGMVRVRIGARFIVEFVRF